MHNYHNPFLYDIIYTSIIVLNKKVYICEIIANIDFPIVGVTGFEPTTSSTPRKRATNLRHTPMTLYIISFLQGYVKYFLIIKKKTVITQMYGYK